MVYLSNKISYKKIILSFGHCFAKINKRGGLNKGWGVLLRARGG